MTTLNIRITLLEEMLGMQPADPEVHAKYIASKAPDAATLADEVAEHGVEAVTENATTVFPRTPDGTPCLYDYQIKGFFKDSAGALRHVKGTRSESLKAYKKLIDGLVFVGPRHIPITFDGEMGVCQRPLRASTPMGERIALASSETVPAGATMELSVTMLDDSMLAAVEEWLSYGRLRGLGQWRNSGKGKFEWHTV